ncbi:interleukin-31 receptor subunit alpha [Xyrichtys novacula]|uniref:Interleukin-31 receptor subunit alpha n=1 Tax=Xyrichtys novacula TaxID=13765 RepID=A0AAV1GD03_XYRNO|nr:interleukin-31 receptor subunit alpha [Xyrichtys novacula]
MVGCGFQLDLLHPLYSSHTSYSQVSILGLIFAYFTTFSSPVRTSAVKCKSKDISSKYAYCEIQSGGVHGLDCFGKHGLTYKTCEWKPGNRSSKSTYTLVIQQQKRLCNAFVNITEFSMTITLFMKYNMTAEVFENIHSKTNCTKSVFSASPSSIWRCGPPSDVSFRRLSGKLVVDVRWEQVDGSVVENYLVKYKALSGMLGSESLVQCQKGAKCTVANVTSSLNYSVQVQCVTSSQCSQCVRSDVYTVPPELTTQPVIVKLENTDAVGRKGQRQLTLAWTFPATELYDGFHVTIWKASGEEPRERITTTRPEIRLTFSYSAYDVSISAFNNASSSPAVSRTIPTQEDKTSLGDKNVNVTVQNATSFTVYWKDNLIEKFVCFSVEWKQEGHEVAHMSFYEDENTYRTLSPLPVPLEPFKRYRLTLHTRPNKDVCNLKHVNNSESTYGSTQFFSREGSPVSAPTNISTINVTLDSVVLQWSPIPEEDTRGFLLGYIIRYAKYRHTGTRTEESITVDPMLDTCELKNLESGTAYKVQIAGVTKAGVGVLSPEILFKTNSQENPNLSSFIIVFAALITVLIFGSHIIKKAKLLLWPSIPNPGKSNTMQKIEGPHELELLESIYTLKVEDGETNSFQLVENEEQSPVPSMLPLLHGMEDDEDQPEMTSGWIDSAAEDTAGDTLPRTASDIPRTVLQGPAFVFPTGYTTIEMFQQGMPGGVQANISLTQDALDSDPEVTDLTTMASRLDYVRQFSPDWQFSPVLEDDGVTVL